MTVRRAQTGAEWVEENFYIPAKMSESGGKIDLTLTPYMRLVLDLFTEPEVRQIDMKWATQLGKTTIMLAMETMVSDLMPGTALIVLPDEDTGERMIRDRLIPSLELSPAARGHMSPSSYDTARKRISLDSMIYYLGSANSPASLASNPCKYLFVDEVGKFKVSLGKEGSPLDLAKERLKTFRFSKCVVSSSPTDRFGVISIEVELSLKVRYHVPCPHCGLFQTLKFSQIKWPEDERDPERIRMRRIAWYECEGCTEKILDYHKPGMLLNGVWCPEGCTVRTRKKSEKPKRVSDDAPLLVRYYGARRPEVEFDGTVPESTHYGTMLNSFYSPFLTFSDAAAQYLEIQGNREKHKNFRQGWEGEDWEERAYENKYDDLKKLMIEYPAKRVPRGAVALVAGADVQENRLYAVVRALGYGEESWLVEHVEIQQRELSALDALLDQRYPSDDGPTLQIRRMGLDSGHRTGEVYRYAAHHPRQVIPVKGESAPKPIPYVIVKVDKGPDGKAIPGGVTYYRIDTTYYKGEIETLQTSDPPLWHVYEGVDEEYLRQITSEQKVIVPAGKNGVQHLWVVKPGSPQNHYWDCETYALAVAQIFERGLRRDMPKPTPPPPKAPKTGDDSWYKTWE